MVLIIECCRLPAVRAAVRQESKTPTLQLHPYISESESADLTSVYKVSAVTSSHDIRQDIGLNCDDVDEGWVCKQL